MIAVYIPLHHPTTAADWAFLGFICAMILLYLFVHASIHDEPPY